jgi:hypothetical protein
VRVGIRHVSNGEDPRNLNAPNQDANAGSAANRSTLDLQRQCPYQGTNRSTEDAIALFMEHTGSDQSIAEYSVHRAIAEGRTLDDAVGAYFAAADAQSRADTHTGGSRHTGSSGSSHFAGRITNMYDQDSRRFGPVEEQPNISVGVATGNGTSSSAGNVPLQAQQVHLTHAQNAKHGDQGAGTDDQGGQGGGGKG